LHGQAFTSDTWQQSNLPTIQTMAALGHRVVAVDLPGFGHSESLPKDKSNGDFLAAVIETLFANDVRRPVVVSPSMSGTYSLELLMKKPGKMSLLSGAAISSLSH
jgi:abhydrolase domain-containing protein 14